MSNDENIGNHKYIGTSILRIYRRYMEIYQGDISGDIEDTLGIYQGYNRYIDGYFEKKYW